MESRSPWNSLGQCGWWAAVLGLLCAGPAVAEERYFLLMFGSQRSIFEGSHNHTFATFVRTRTDPSQPDKTTVEAHTLSWLPDNGKVRGFALFPETGRNFDLHETLCLVQDDGQHVALWGPFEIKCELYEAARAEIALVESGHVRYKSFDAGYRSDRVTNYSHALRSIAEGQRHRGPVWLGGYGSAKRALRSMSPWVIDAGHEHGWVADALGLDCPR